MRHATAHDGFALWLQPRYGLAYHDLRGAEVQARWPHRGSIGTPASFMQLVEECGLADAVIGWTLASACKAASGWAPGPYVAVGVPHLRDAATLLRQIAAAIGSSGLAPGRLQIELPIGARLLGDDDLNLLLSVLADRGIGTVLTGFGGDMADLLPLKLMPLAALKLDRSLVRDLPNDRAAAAIALCAIDYAHRLGGTVIAEGVDTVAQRDFLGRACCDEAQGALFGGLVSADTCQSSGPGARCMMAVNQPGNGHGSGDT